MEKEKEKENARGKTKEKNSLTSKHGRLMELQNRIISLDKIRHSRISSVLKNTSTADRTTQWRQMEHDSAGHRTQWRQKRHTCPIEQTCGNTP